MGSSFARSLRLEGFRVLVAEDDPDQRECLVECLKSEGAKVSAAPSGNYALTAFLQEKPDVIVSDLWMPDGTGYEFIDRVRKLTPEGGGLTPAIAVSASENTRAALMAGFHVFIEKPIDWFKLVETIGEFVRPSGGQVVAPWTLSLLEVGRLLITFVGRVEAGDAPPFARSLLVHLEAGPMEIVCDLRRLTGFSPAVASAMERAVWPRRGQIRGARLVGASLMSRVVAAATCRMLGIPITFSDELGQ
jgi:CheY-like chemotaxis protein